MLFRSMKGDASTWVSWLIVFAALPLLAVVGCRQGAKTANTAAPIASLEGTLDLATTAEIAGWAWDRKQPDSIISIDIYDGDAKITTVQADQFREDLQKAKIGNGKHSFSLPTPDSLKDGKSHKIRAKLSGTNQELTESPRNLK